MTLGSDLKNCKNDVKMLQNLAASQETYLNHVGGTIELIDLVGVSLISKNVDRIWKRYTSTAISK